ncbi:MAG: flagellar export chaperone FliS [Bryobacteraceae bacterium]
MRRKSYLESRILTADPVELIQILYEHALIEVRNARACQREGDIAGRAKSVTKLLAILGELEASLNHKVGGSISQNLSRLYQYMRRKLLEASVTRQTAPLDEVESLLETLNEGWSAIQHKTAAPASASNPYRAEAHTLLPSSDTAEAEYTPQSWCA